MIKSLHLGNFKAFADIEHVPIRPLTLIFGANSAGKSSILHGLILAHESIQKGNLDVFKSELGGESVDLGGFRQYVHRRNDHNRVSISLEIESKDLSDSLRDLLGGQKSIGITFEIGLAQREVTESKPVINPLTNKIELTEVPTGKYETGKIPKILSYELTTSAGSILRMSRRPNDVMQLDLVNDSHPVVKNLIDIVILSFTTTATVFESDWEVVRETLTELVPKLSSTGTSIPQRLDIGTDLQEAWKARLLPVSKSTRKSDLATALEVFIPRKIDELLRGIYSTVIAKLETLMYLGPLRSYPPRLIQLFQDRDANWKAGGGYAWDLVLKDEKLRSKVNEWLSDSKRLSTPYTLVVKKLYDLDDFVEAFQRQFSGDELLKLREELRKVMDQLREMMEKHQEQVPISKEEASKLKGLAGLLTSKTEWDAGFPWKEVEEAEQKLIPIDIALNLDYTVDELIDSHFELLSKIALRDLHSSDYLSLLDNRTRTAVSHRDVGIGISQVLPVLVYSYAHSNQCIAIEQPEIHLHPALQAELGDVFIESALGEQKNTFILETHSEHLILRMLRRIRETSSGELPAGKHPLRPEDIQVLYVQPTSKGSVVHSLTVTPDGDFAEKWPEGFFEERAEELF